MVVEAIRHTSDSEVTPSARVRGAVASTWRAERPGLVLAAFIVALMALPATYDLLHGGSFYGYNDMQEHIDRALRFELWPPQPLVPHFGTHVLIRAFWYLGGQASTTAPMFVLVALSRAAAGALVYLAMRGILDGEGPCLPRRWAVGATVACFLVESPRVLIDGVEMSSGHAFLPLQYLMGPTHTGSLPATIVLVSLLVRLARTVHRRRPTTSYLVAVPIVVVLTATLKPSFLQGSLVIVLPWIAWWVHRRGREVRRALVWTLLLVVVPAVLVLIWQVWWFASGMESEADRTSIVLDPLGGYRAAGYSFVPLLACWLPVAGLLAAGRRYLTDPKVSLLLLSTIVGAAQFFLLNESGFRYDHGNVGKVFQTCVILLGFESVRWTAAELRARGISGVGAGGRIAAGAVVVAFLAGGCVAWVYESVPVFW